MLVGMASLAASRNFPTAGRIDEHHAFQQQMYQNNLLCLAKEEANARNGIKLPISICINSSADDVRKEMADELVFYEYRSGNVLRLQLESVGRMIVLWLILCGILYLLGLIVAWIVRGFRPGAKMTS